MLSSHQLDIKRNDFFFSLLPPHIMSVPTRAPTSLFLTLFFFPFPCFLSSSFTIKNAVVYIYHNPLSGNKEFKAEPWAVKAFNRADRKKADKPKSCVKDSSHVPQTDVSSSVCSL